MTTTSALTSRVSGGPEPRGASASILAHSVGWLTMESVSPAAFRDAMATIPAPISIVTAMDGEVPRGVTVSAFASLSLNPPMLMVAIDRQRPILSVITSAGRFGVNVLGGDQIDASKVFAASGADKFAHVSWTLSSGLPRLTASPGWIACELSEITDGGDHAILLGRAIDVDAVPGTALAYHQRRYVPYPAPDGTRGGTLNP